MAVPSKGISSAKLPWCLWPSITAHRVPRRNMLSVTRIPNLGRLNWLIMHRCEEVLPGSMIHGLAKLQIKVSSQSGWGYCSVTPSRGLKTRWMPVAGKWVANCWNSMTVFPNNQHWNTWPMQVPYSFFGTNVEHQPQIRKFHYFLRSTAVSPIDITLEESYQQLEMEARNKKVNVCGFLWNERYIFEKNDVAAGISNPLVGIMMICVLRLARSHILEGKLPPPLAIVFSTRTHCWGSNICGSRCSCCTISSVWW